MSEQTESQPSIDRLALQLALMTAERDHLNWVLDGLAHDIHTISLTERISADTQVRAEQRLRTFAEDWLNPEPQEVA